MIETKRLEQYIALLALALLCLASLLVIRPFMSAVLLALILTISTWPLYDRVLALTKGKKTLSALIVTLGLSAALILPMVFLVSSLGDEVRSVSDRVRLMIDGKERIEPPEWLRSVPVVGNKAASAWQDFALNRAELARKLRPYASQATGALLAVGAAFGGALFELCVALLISFFFFRDGVALAEKLRTVMTKLAGTRAEGLIRTAGLTLKGVVYGILGTAVVQGILAAIGFMIAGVPAAAMLGFITCFLSLVPVGPPLVWIPAALWLFANGDTPWAIFVALWGMLVVSGADNVVKPYLISKGSNLPLILIFVGVIGGALQFGFLGVFLGPTLLALVYSLVKEWISQPHRGHHRHAEAVAAEG